VRRWLAVAAILIAATGIGVAVLPFDRPAPVGTYTYGDIGGSPQCTAPIVSAWRNEGMRAGWFGYAPLTSRPLQPCRGAARERLGVAALLEGGGLLVWLLSRRRFGGRADAKPNLAT
jgi:hypothetical protein